jgi:phosphoenolpyruvate synthase/pyruvate phosphate dikinase
MPDDIVEAIGRAYAELGEGNLLPVAVRSSATAEDLPEMSFAGRQETYLNMRGTSGAGGCQKVLGLAVGGVGGCKKRTICFR